MKSTDLNLLTALDALLAEGSVTGAARRLGLSVSAMHPRVDADPAQRWFRQQVIGVCKRAYPT